MKQIISSSLKFVAPNTSKLIIDDVGKKIYKKTFAKYGKKNKTDIDKETIEEIFINLIKKLFRIV